MSSWLTFVAQNSIFAVIRGSSPTVALAMGTAAAQGGLRLLEVAWNTPEAPKVIATLRETYPQCQVGAGTILDSTMAQAAIACGSQFLFSPAHEAAIITLAQKNHIPIVAGALTPAEILLAWQQGATAVKIFPIQSVGGPQYLKFLRPVFPEIPFIPTGGISQGDIPALFAAGALALGMSSYLFPPDRVRAEDWQGIATRIAAVVGVLRPQAEKIKEGLSEPRLE